MRQEEQRRAQGPQQASTFADAQLNPMYQELRSQNAAASREVAATQTRMGIAESMLADELNRSRRIAESESDLAELTRDYEVNRDIYQDLLLSLIHISQPEPGKYDAVILAVSHNEFIALGADGIRAFGKPGAVLFDVKRALPRASVDDCL